MPVAPIRPVSIDGVEIGGDTFTVIAGPCAVESETQILRTAERVARAGAKILRGGAFKPRTSPYAFQGLGLEGLKLLAKARRETGLRVVTEVMSVAQVDIVSEYADMLQVGSRNMSNAALLTAVAKAGKPILFKRGMSATVAEYAEAAQFLCSRGTQNLVLCERGVRTFETATRNTCDITAIPLLHVLTGLPVIVDPSHATGVRDLVAPVSCAAVAAGAYGLIIEVHPDPDRALSDGMQSLSCEQFDELMEDIEPFVRIWSSRKRMACGVASAV
jgi:3-deoxy-7-phosphoheptulonate synthase